MSKTPTLIEDPDQLKTLKKPIKFESQGEENLYFTDGSGKRYYTKDPSPADEKKFRGYFEKAASNEKVARLSQRHLLDYMLNSFEHEIVSQNGVDYLIDAGYDTAFAQDFIDTWERERPDMTRSPDRGKSLFAQEEAAKKLLAKVMQKHHVRYASDIREPVMDTKTRLAKKLVRLAYANPDKRAAILSVIKKLAGGKTAAKPETEEFTRWVLSTQAPMTPNEVESFVVRGLGIKTQPMGEKGPKGPRYKKGDSIIICADKHNLAKFDKGNYDLYDKKTGTVTEIDGVDVLAMIKGGPNVPVRFPGGMSPMKVGVMKYSKPYTIAGSAMIEMMYFAGGKPTKDQVITVDAYIGRGGATESRSANYYSGHIVMGAEGSNGYYFRGYPQQRMTVESAGCTVTEGFGPRSFNPSLGRVYYIGLMGKRPNHWQEELAALDEAAGAGAPKD